MPHSLANNFRFTQAEGGGVLLDLTDGEYWQLNQACADLLQSVIDGHSVAQVTIALSEQYPDNSERVASDVNSILNQLQEIGAIIE